MSQRVQVSQGWQSDMQMAGKLALSAAALLLLALAYKIYKSRSTASVQGKGSVKADTANVTGPSANAGQDGAESADARERPPELRCRQASSNGVRRSGSKAKPSACLGGKVTTGPQSAPGRRVHSLPDRGEEEEEGREGSQPVSESQPGGRKPASEAGGHAPGAGRRAGAGARAGGAAQAAPAAGGELGGKQNSCNRLGPARNLPGSEGDSSGPGQDLVSPGSELCLGPEHSSCNTAQPASAPELPAGPSPDTETGARAGDMSDSSAWVPEARLSRGRLQTLHVTSDLGLMVNQSNKSADTSYTFSSTSRIQVEENYIKEAGDDRRGRPTSSASSLRGKVYDYYVQSTSQSVSKKRPCTYSPPGTPSFLNSAQISEELHDFETWLHQGTAPRSAGRDGDKGSPPANAPLGSLGRPAEGSSEPPGGSDASEAAGSLPGAQELPGRSFSRKESFLQIAENPELQVPMEGFGASSPPSRKSNSSPSPAKPTAVASLVESMHGLQTDASPEARVELVAGANFFQVPLSFESAVDIRLDLGNCFEVLCMAKKQKLDHLKEAAYKVMSDNYLQVLKNASIYGRLNAMERELILRRRMKGRKYVTVADVSTHERSFRASRLSYYNDESDAWYPLAHMPQEAVSKGCALCSMFNYVFVVAGCEGIGRYQKPSNRVFCYNPLTNIWREICPLNQARPHCKLVALDGYLYAIGGECLYTVERYDPRQDRWSFAAPLPNDTFAVAHTATACNGEIYVTGGTLRYMLLRYVSRTDSWRASLTSGSKDRTTEMVTVDGFLYRFDLNRSMGISVYRCGIKAKLWYECATNRMPYPACFQCAVVDNLIYCVSRQFIIRFLADYISPRFGAKELQAFPSPKGTLFPVVLMLPDRDTVQTRV
ncbi:PREDICTED: kelch domain-containing protein 7A [Crocodylus porosus]|uniref:kelch domain-containing protein 7A n=1 Tax=Crocodylus porosus TaxID=8502 RepID=UPI00093D7638|nr:PREDICTED: kelch domain-containing protein 7A [Crocodylus porosus]